MAEMWLIEPEALETALYNEIYMNDSTKAAFRAVIRKVPMVKAAPVAHGRWEPDPHHSDGKPYRDEVYGYVFKCSLCGGKTVGDYDLKCAEMYCRHCGAKMDGGSGDD